MPEQIPVELHKILMTYSTRGERGPTTDFDRGYHAGLYGKPVTENPHKRKIRVGVHGNILRDKDGNPRLHAPSKRHLAWLDGWTEGDAAKRGELLVLMNRRREEAEGKS